MYGNWFVHECFVKKVNNETFVFTGEMLLHTAGGRTDINSDAAS